jgi:hypothetical protein
MRIVFLDEGGGAYDFPVSGSHWVGDRHGPGGENLRRSVKKINKNKVKVHRWEV